MKRLAVLLTMLGVVIGCSEQSPVGESPTGNDRPHLSTFDSITGRCSLYPPASSTCGSVTVTATPAFYPNYQCSNVCEIPQPDPVHFVFSKPVYQIEVTGNGGFYCLS